MQKCSSNSCIITLGLKHLQSLHNCETLLCQTFLLGPTAVQIFHALPEVVLYDLNCLISFHQACKNGLVQHLEHLLYYGAEIDARTATGNTALHVAALNNQVTQPYTPLFPADIFTFVLFMCMKFFRHVTFDVQLSYDLEAMKLGG